MLTHLNYLAIAIENITNPEGTSSIILGAEGLLMQVALFLKVILEFIAILTIAIAVFLSFQRFLRQRSHPRDRNLQQSIRLDLGLSLALSLEFLLAADIVGTAVSPGWDAIAKLAAITGIRTFLNFFLHQEVREMQKNTTVTQPYVQESANL
jgi:uncharacterized membrane protein